MCVVHVCIQTLGEMITVRFAEYMLVRVSLKSSALKWAPQTYEFLEGSKRIISGSEFADDVAV